MYILEPLLEKAENYAKTSFELYRLKTIDKSANIISDLVARGIVFSLIFTFLALANIGFSIWLGDILGELYYGFLCVAAIYGIIGAFVYFFMNKYIKKQVRKSIISQLQN